MRLYDIKWDQIIANNNQFLQTQIPYQYGEFRVNVPQNRDEPLDNTKIIKLVDEFNKSQGVFSASVKNGTKVKFSRKILNIDFKEIDYILGGQLQNEGHTFRMKITTNDGVSMEPHEINMKIYKNNLNSAYPFRGQKRQGADKYEFILKSPTMKITKNEIMDAIDEISHMTSTTSTTKISEVFDKLNSLSVYPLYKNHEKWNGGYIIQQLTDQRSKDRMTNKLYDLLCDYFTLLPTEKVRYLLRLDMSMKGIPTDEYIKIFNEKTGQNIPLKQAKPYEFMVNYLETNPLE
jgi:hypothetical protein